MRDKRKGSIVRSLEKSRTHDPSSQPHATDYHPFVHTRKEVEQRKRKRWFKRVSFVAVFIIIFSISLTAYASYDYLMGSEKSNSEKKRSSQVKATSHESVETKLEDQEVDAEEDETLQLEFEEEVDTKNVSNKKRVTPSSSVSTSHSKSSSISRSKSNSTTSSTSSSTSRRPASTPSSSNSSGSNMRSQPARNHSPSQDGYNRRSREQSSPADEERNQRKKRTNRRAYSRER